MNLVKAIKGLARLKWACDYYIDLKRITGSTISGIEENHFHGGIQINDPRFKLMPNNNHTLAGIIREDIHSNGLHLTKNKGNQGSDLYHPSVKQYLKSVKKTINQINHKDFGQGKLHCEHIMEIDDTEEVNLKRLSAGKKIPILDLIDIIEKRTAVVTILKSHKLISGAKGFDRYKNSPPEFNGTPVTSMTSLLALRKKHKNPIYQIFQDLRNPNINWKKEISQVDKDNKKRLNGWKKFPDLTDPMVKRLLKKNNNMEIVKQLYPDHLKRRFLRESYKSKAKQIAIQEGFVWYK
jgi:hypothetical protein